MRSPGLTAKTTVPIAWLVAVATATAAGTWRIATLFERIEIRLTTLERVVDKLDAKGREP